MNRNPMLELDAIDAGYGGFQALAGVTLEVRLGEAVAVLCQEGARAPCCTRDEGRPFGAVL